MLISYRKKHKNKFLFSFIFYYFIFLISLILNLTSKYYLANIIDYTHSSKLYILFIVNTLYSLIFLIFIWEIYLILKGSITLLEKEIRIRFNRYFITLSIISLAFITIGFIIFIEGFDTVFLRIFLAIGTSLVLLLFFFIYWKIRQLKPFKVDINKIISFIFIFFSLIFSFRSILFLFSVKGGVEFPFRITPSLYLIQSLISIFIIKFLIEPYLKKNNIKNTTTERLFDFIDHFKLSKRESEVANLILSGKTNNEIEDKLFISLRTVKFHTGNIYKKALVKSRNQFINLFRNS